MQSPDVRSEAGFEKVQLMPNRAAEAGKRWSEGDLFLKEAQPLEVEAAAKHLSPARPWSAWALLVAAILAVSSAAVTFASMSEVPPVTMAAWV